MVASEDQADVAGTLWRSRTLGMRWLLGAVPMAPLWYLGALLLAVLVTAPIVALLFVAGSAEDNVWPHLMATVLPRAAITTIQLMAGVGLLTAVIGVGTAWLITMYRFPGRDLLQWALVVPLAMPTYLIAFCYLEIWDYSGWVQTGLRAAFGWQSARDYWFPEIRSLPGAIMVMSFVLYPYVYLTSRASFLQQSVCTLEVSRTLGCTAWGAFLSIGLPMARPAIAAGVTLALMECLNDIGAVEFFGVNTLTVSVYATWLERGSLGGAAQIASLMLLFVLVLLLVERWSRRERQFHHTSNRYQDLTPVPLKGVRGWLVTLICLLPVVAGFAVPSLVLIEATMVHWYEALTGPVWQHAFHSVTIAAAAAAIAVAISTVLVFVLRMSRSAAVAAAARIASVGYAVPGTVLAIGVLVAFSAFESAAGTAWRAVTGLQAGLIISGTSAAIVFAYVVRFLAVSFGAVESGASRLSPNLDTVARSLGRKPARILMEVQLPLLKSAIGAAALLVFVDAMKELPATLLLRPFNFDTLATHIYTLASLDLFEESAPAALMIVAIGLLPVIWLNNVVATGRRSGV